MKFSLIKFKPHQEKGLTCLNCGQPLSGNENFCSYCGQKNATNKLTFGNFIQSIFSGFFSYDSRFWKTFVPLLTKPGLVSQQYIEGKRARFVNPFQLYLNVSIIFFLLIGISNKLNFDNNQDALIENTTQNDSLATVEAKKIDSVLTTINTEVANLKDVDSAKTQIVTDLNSAFDLAKKIDTTISNQDYKYAIDTKSVTAISVVDKFQDFHHFYKKHPTYAVENALDSLGYEKSFWNKMYYQQTINSNKNYEKYQKEGAQEFFKTVTSYISISLFVFLPFFTLFLCLIYIRKKFTYIENLVFVFHVQTVFFLLLAIFYLLNLVADTDGFLLIFTLLFAFYLYKALRNFYKQSRLKTLFKFMLLNSFYMVLATIGFAIIAVLSFIVG